MGVAVREVLLYTVTIYSSEDVRSVASKNVGFFIPPDEILKGVLVEASILSFQHLNWTLCSSHDLTKHPLWAEERVGGGFFPRRICMNTR